MIDSQFAGKIELPPTFTSLWSGLSVDEQLGMFCLAPFRHTINTGESLIVEFTDALKTEIGHSVKDDIHSALFKAQAYGWLRRVIAFPDTELFHIHPLFTTFLSDRIKVQLPALRQQAIIRAFLSYYNWLSTQLYNMYMHTTPEERQENLDFMDWEYENLLVALRYSIEIKQYDFTPVYLALDVFLTGRRQHSEKRRVTEWLKAQILDVNSDGNLDDLHFSLVDIYNALGATAVKLENHEQAETYFEEALSLYKRYDLSTHYPEAVRALYQNMAMAKSLLGKQEEAEHFFQKMIVTAERYSDTEGLANFYFNYGYQFFRQGQLNDAVDFFKKARLKFQSLKQADDEAEALVYLGKIAIVKNEFQLARPHFEEALEIFTALGEQGRIAHVYAQLSMIELSFHNYTKAQNYAKKALELNIISELPEEQGMVFYYMCASSASLGDFLSCRDYLMQSLAIFLKLKDEDWLGRIIRMAGIVDSHEKAGLTESVVDEMEKAYSLEEIKLFFNNAS